LTRLQVTDASCFLTKALHS